MYISKVKPDKIRIIINSTPVEDFCLEGCWHCCTRECFKGVVLTEEEYISLKDYGAIHLSYDDDSPMLNFGKKRCCEFLEHGKCTLYKSELRPMNCRLFSCS